MLTVLREEHWQHVREQIARDIEQNMPLVLIPPEDEREWEHETLTTVDKWKTEKARIEDIA